MANGETTGLESAETMSLESIEIMSFESAETVVQLWEHWNMSLESAKGCRVASRSYWHKQWILHTGCHSQFPLDWPCGSGYSWYDVKSLRDGGPDRTRDGGHNGTRLWNVGHYGTRPWVGGYLGKILSFMKGFWIGNQFVTSLYVSSCFVISLWIGSHVGKKFCFSYSERGTNQQKCNIQMFIYQPSRTTSYEYRS